MDRRLIQAAMARSGIYRALSLLFLYPDEAWLSAMSAEVSKITALLPDLLPDERDGLEEAWTNLIGEDLALEHYQAEYRQTFGHTISQECPPYETQYGSAHLFQQAQVLGDIAGFYRAFGLEVSDLAKERLDHIAVELEFMAFLALKEAYALTHDGEEKAAICRDAQRKFLVEHLGRWAPLFAKLLGRKVQEGFYRRLASFLEIFIAAECRSLEARPSTFHEGDLVANAYEPEGTCFSCGTQDLCFAEPKEEQ
jgi:DMSO reductase family type II enzyme chaperone